MSTKEEEKEESVDQSEDIENNSAESVDTDELVEEQQKRINELEEELEKLKDTQLRKAAEMENMRKRMQREREQIFRTSREVALEAFLPVNDDLIRTLNALKDANADSSYLEGVELVANKFQNVLEQYGVERIDQTGVPFDVNLHDAMLNQKPGDDSIESGTVLQVLENGYRIGDKTIRHAKVIVSE
ncbi:MAG: nucleotide exchange factor GrpE [Balneolaceae bacterium]